MTELTQEAIDRAKSILVFEQRVLQHRVEGLTAEQSAERLEVHASTVEACRKHLLLTDGRAWRAGKRGASKRQLKQAAGLAELRAEAHNRHTDECLAGLTDPGGACVCRPPAVAEPLVGQLGALLNKVPGTAEALRKNLRRSLTPTPNVVRAKR